MFLDRLKIREEGENVFEIRKTKRSAVPGLLASLIWYPLCYAILYFHFSRQGGAVDPVAYFTRPVHLLFYALPLWYVPVTLGYCRLFLRGVLFVFDKGQNVFSVNGKQIARLSDIEQIQMMTLRVIDQTEQQLNIFLKEGRVFRIDQSDHYDEISHIGRRLAVFLGIEIVDLHR